MGSFALVRLGLVPYLRLGVFVYSTRARFGSVLALLYFLVTIAK